MKLKTPVRFPFFITAALFIVMTALLIPLAVFVKYTHINSGINGFILQVNNVSTALLTAYADAAGNAYRAQSNAQLLRLFKDDTSVGIQEVLFVLDDGTIFAHSDETRAAQLKGNIANDEFYYNIDMILNPNITSAEDVFIKDYFIPDVVIPFDKAVRSFIRQYIYAGIDTNSWLATKAVLVKGKRVGTVNCIIAKTPIHDMIRVHAKELLLIIAIICTASLFLAVVVGIIIFIKQKNMYAIVSRNGVSQRAQDSKAAPLIKDAIPVKE